MSLELGSLQKAVSALHEVLAKCEDEAFMRQLDDVARNAMRSGAIQHFEFTYELCLKLMKRWLELNIGPAAADGATVREVFRRAVESQLIVDVEAWMRHRDARNRTSHTYDLAVADVVYAAAHDFARDAKGFLQALEVRND